MEGTNLKHSRQRDAIMEFLRSRKDHPTADTVYMNVREQFPNISLGTVYRNLTLLSEIGQIQKLNLGDGADHFDACTNSHYHFLCTECGRVSDLDLQDSLDPMDKIAAEGFNGTIQGHVTYFYGTCADCMKSEKTLKSG